MSTAEPHDPETLRVAAAIDHWQRKLLDLSRRNRALNFRMTRVSTVAIVDEQPAAVFRRLYLQEKPMKFRAALPVAPAAPEPSPADPAAAAPPGEDALDGLAADLPAPLPIPMPDLALYEAAALSERHRDDLLQTAAPADRLDISLRRIEEGAREALEEQGVNTLFLALGMLHWKEAPQAEEVSRAPLILLPVALSRRSAAAGYSVAATDDDPLVNPALAELLRRQHAIVLPELPDWAAMPGDYDLQTFFQGVTAAVAPQPGWRVTAEIYLGLFAFQKLAMYKDLETHAAAFAAHRLVRQLVTRRGGEGALLPAEVREMELDEHFPPERTAQVVDADASQLRALAATARGHDLVLEGPPGTGKSQTITNLIAQALAAGQSVLFVAEKMAALQVVHERLARAGLGDFCLELHSTKANKRAVVKEIARALDASLQRVRPAAPGEAAGARLPAVRRALTEYAEAVHAPWGALGLTPYQGFGELLALRDAPRLRREVLAPVVPLAEITRADFEDAVRDLEELARAAADLAGQGGPAAHPWRGSERTFWTEDDLERARALAADLRGHLAEAIRAAAEVQAALGLPAIGTLAEADVAVQAAGAIGRSPGARLAVLTSAAWDAPPREALELLERGARLAALRDHTERRFHPGVLEEEHAADIRWLEEKESGLLRLLNPLSGRFRALRRRWLGYRLPSYAGTLLEQAADLRKVDELRRERAWLQGRDAAARELFGAHWQGERSDWAALDAYVRWVVELRRLTAEHGLSSRAAELAARPAPEVPGGAALRAAVEAVRTGLAGLRELGQWPAGAFEEPLAALVERVTALETGTTRAPRWAAYEMVRQRVAAGLAAGMLAPAQAGEVPFAGLARAFRRAFHQGWVGAAVAARPPLCQFATLSHEQRAAEFRRLDELVLRENRQGLVASLREQVQARLRSPLVEDEAMPFLQREMARERRHSPLRRTLRVAGPAIRAIKPCFLMSPLTVAQLLEGNAPSFDVVIFDEASQLPSEDAVGAIVRGARLVVVGDPKQLPPTNFFAVMSGQEAAPLAEDGTPLFEDTESVLEEFLGAGVPKTRLRWHYRSTHESLITFSNVSFYDADLFTFPSVETGSHAAGLCFEHVADGLYEGKGLNAAEARRVADAVVRHAREHPDLSLGVGTFNLRQQLAIQDELELRRRADPALEPFFSRAAPEPFFVKNLENIQGDERDVIFLSVTYARARDGKLRYNFGPINGENGWRRLNVLTTRARRRMVVFSSIRGDDIGPVAAASRGPQLLRDFLLYAERGSLTAASDRAASGAAGAQSPFECEVLAELTARGLRLQPQVGVAGYRIDFGVLDGEVPGRYVCGIECDGAAYHASETARDRDRLRQQVLEDRGWELHRLWSTDWFKDREGQIERLLQRVEESRRRVREEAAAPAAGRALPDPAPPPPPEPAVAPAPVLPGPPARPVEPSRPGTRLPAERIPPERYRETALAVLRELEAGAGLPRRELTNRVRARLGFGRTGARLEEAIGAALDGLLADGTLGVGSTGLCLREEPGPAPASGQPVN